MAASCLSVHMVSWCASGFRAQVASKCGSGCGVQMAPRRGSGAAVVVAAVVVTAAVVVGMPPLGACASPTTLLPRGTPQEEAYAEARPAQTHV
eukprot:321507-Chlamydomonas_euryale.AAC.6